jgi:hypothetical protein
MANKRKYIYGKQFAQKLPGSPNNPLLPNQGNYYFRTVTTYEVDNNGNPIQGTAGTNLYYAPKPAAKTSNGKIWTSGTADSIDNFNQGGWVVAGLTSDGGKTYKFERYTQEDADLGRIPSGKNVGDVILGATAQQSLSTSGGRFYEAVQNNLINLAANTQTGLAQVVSAKQANAVIQQQNQEPELTEEQKEAAKQQQISEDVSDAIEKGKEGLTTIEITASYRKTYENLFYPQDLQSNRQDRIKFVMGRKSGSSIKTDFSAGKQAIERKEDFKSIEGSVTLPIQPGISDSNTVDWSGATLNAIQAYAAASSMQMIGSSSVTDLASQAGTILGEIAKEITTDGNYSQALKTYFAQEAVGAQNLLSRTSGAIINPNLELLFNGPSLRPFAFTFRLSPRDSKEAEQVRKIIRFFKQGMSVKTSSSNIFVQSPNIFKINYLAYDNEGNSIDHPSINRIKTCALLSCDVDYTPDGSYMTYSDDSRTMTSYQLSLRFSELEPIFDNDYSDESGAAANPFNINPGEIGF